MPACRTLPWASVSPASREIADGEICIGEVEVEGVGSVLVGGDVGGDVGVVGSARMVVGVGEGVGGEDEGSSMGVASEVSVSRRVMCGEEKFIGEVAGVVGGGVAREGLGS